MVGHIKLVTEIQGKMIDREEVLAWELGRTQKMLQFLGASETESTGDVDTLRERLYELKRAIGPEELQRRVAGKVRIADLGANIAARLARGKRAQSAVKIQIPSGTAEEFAAWFEAQSELANPPAMLAAHPDHYFIGEDEQQRQKVVETTGGAPLPSEFFIDYQDISSLITPADSAYPFQIAGVARTAKGLAIGGVRHQFRNLPGGGFESWNTVEFPSNVGSRIISGHSWHLACEFGNWIEFQQQGKYSA